MVLEKNTVPLCFSKIFQAQAAEERKATAARNKGDNGRDKRGETQCDCQPFSI